MMQKKMRFVIWMILGFILISTLKVYANDYTKEFGKEQQEDIIDYQMELFNWEEIEKLQKKLSHSSAKESDYNLKEEVIEIVKGNKKFKIEELVLRILEMLLGEIHSYIKLGIRFILVVLLCSMLQSLSSSFQSKDTNKVAFFVCYMVIVYSVVDSVTLLTSLAKETIDQMSEVMYICMPTLLAFMSSSGYISSSAAMAPIVITALNLITYVIKVLVLPCIISVLALEIVGTISEDFKIDKIIQLFYRGIKLALRGIFFISIAILGFYKSTMPYIDKTVQKGALKISSAFIPIVGDAVDGAIDFIVNCSLLMKNAFSIAVILWLVILVSIPLIHMFAFVVVYHIAGAVIEPLGDKKMAQIAVKIAKGGEFIMSCVGIVALLCMSVLMICMSVGSNIA